MTRLRAAPIVGEALSLCSDRLGAWLRIAALPWTALVVARQLVLLRWPGASEEVPPAIASCSNALDVLCVALFGIAWHRHILLGEKVASWWRCHAWTRRHLPFIAWAFALSAPAHVIEAYDLELDLGAIGSVLNLLVVLALGYGLARLSVALPATAVGSRGDPRSVWTLSRGSGWMLLVIPVLAALAASLVLLPLYVLIVLVETGLEHADAGPITWATLPLREAAAFVVAAVEVASLSVCYRSLRAARSI